MPLRPHDARQVVSVANEIRRVVDIADEDSAGPRGGHVSLLTLFWMGSNNPQTEERIRS